MTLKLTLLVTSLCLLHATHTKAEFNYDYIETDYQYLEMETVDPFGQPLSLAADGFGIEFSHDYDTGILLLGSYTRSDFDGEDDFESTQNLFKIGAGYRYSFNEFYDVYGTSSFVGLETDLPGIASTENGFEVAGGLRIRSSEALELHGSIVYSDIEGSATADALGDQGYRAGPMVFQRHFVRWPWSGGWRVHDIVLRKLPRSVWLAAIRALTARPQC